MSQAMVNTDPMTLGVSACVDAGAGVRAEMRHSRVAVDDTYGAETLPQTRVLTMCFANRID